MPSLGIYEPLAPDPLPLGGPRVTNPAARVLRLLLRVFNVALAALGLLLIGWALWVGEAYHRSDDKPPSGPDGTGGGGDEGRTNGSVEQLPVLVQPVADGARGVAAVAAALLAGVLQSDKVASFPWFIYLVAGAGAYCFATSLCGLSSLRRNRRLQLGTYILLLAGLLLAEAAATVLFLTDNSWRAGIPDDPSGAWQEAQAYVASHSRGVRLGAVAALGAELAALAAACWLHAIYTAAWEKWADDREERSERVREVLNRAVVQTYAGGSGSSWASRLRSKYGVEASALEAATVGARQTAALQSDPF